jgi:carboxypeptidase C (cathepsin A)
MTSGGWQNCGGRITFSTAHTDTSAKGVLETTQLPNFHLSGIAIGNGWIDPYAQYPTFADFAYDKKLIVKGSAVSFQLRCRMISTQCGDLH